MRYEYVGESGKCLRISHCQKSDHRLSTFSLGSFSMFRVYCGFLGLLQSLPSVFSRMLFSLACYVAAQPVGSLGRHITCE